MVLASQYPAGAQGVADELTSRGAERAAEAEFAGRHIPDLRQIVALLRRDWWLVAGALGAALIFALLATAFATPRYVAQAAIQINDASARVLGTEEESGEAQVANHLDTERFLKTQVDVLRSQGLANRVAKKLRLEADPAFFAAQNTAADAAGSSPAEIRHHVLALLIEHLKVELPRDSRIVTISYESNDPKLSARIANTYVAEFIESNLQRKFESSSYARDFVSRQLAEAKQRLEGSERALNGYARAAGLIRTRDAAAADGDQAQANRGGSVTTSSLLELNTAANAATARRITAEGRWREISSGSALNAAEVLSNPGITAMLTQKATIQAELSEDQARHLSDYPTVRAKQAQLQTITNQIEGAANNIRRAVRADYQAAVATEQKLNQRVEQLKNASLSEQDRTVQYGLLAREADTNRQVYDGLLQRYKQLNAASGISLSNISVIDAADPPVRPSSPSLARNLLVGGLLGLFLAALLVFLRHQFDDSVRVPDDVADKLGLPLLGVVPRVATEQPAEALADPKSDISEAYNSLRATLLYSTAEGLPQVMLFTSAQPSEGKTTSATAIATGLAKLGKRTLLIDADLRRPSLHHVADLKNEIGLSTLLTSSGGLESAIVPAPVDNLSFLPSGPLPASPTELISGPRMEQIVALASRQFDVVVIDSPPVLGLADAPILSALADGVILIVEAERSRRGSLRTALRRLQAMRPVLIGAVLTKFDAAKAGYNYAEYYGYGAHRYGA